MFDEKYVLDDLSIGNAVPGCQEERARRILCPPNNITVKKSIPVVLEFTSLDRMIPVILSWLRSLS